MYELYIEDRKRSIGLRSAKRAAPVGRAERLRHFVTIVRQGGPAGEVRLGARFGRSIVLPKLLAVGTIWAWSCGLSDASALAAEAKASGKQTYSLAEAVDLALRQNPRLAGSRLQASASRDSAWSARGHLLPVVKLGATYDYVRANEGLNLSAFTGPPQPGAAATPPLRINFWGGDANVTVAQPILGLLHISQDYAAADRAADAAAVDLRTSEDELRTQVEYGYLSLFEARAEKGIAQSSHDQLTDQLHVAQAQFKDGSLTKADVLRVQVAAANADQQQIQAPVQEENAKDQLLGLLGLAGSATSDSVDFADPTEDLAARQLPSLGTDSGAAQAEQNRPELASAQLQSDAAWHRKQARYFNLLPEVNASYSYYRLLNTPEFLPRDIELVGFGASWNVWDWGATYFEAHAAGAQLEAAAQNREAVRQQVDVEVRTRAAQERAAANAVQVASETIAQAEEAFRVTQATVRVGAATHHRPPRCPGGADPGAVESGAVQVRGAAGEDGVVPGARVGEELSEAALRDS